MFFKSPHHLFIYMINEYSKKDLQTTMYFLLSDMHLSPNAYMITILYLLRKMYEMNDSYFPTRLFKTQISRHWKEFNKCII